jgi:hypothetical protein
MNTVSTEAPPPDAFKREYKRKEKKSDFTEKPNYIVHNNWRPRDPDEAPPPA